MGEQQAGNDSEGSIDLIWINGENFAAMRERITSLTPQQFRVMGMLMEGLQNKVIAYQLDVSEATVKAHMTAIFRKLGVRNRTQAVLALKDLAIEPPGLA